MASRDQSIVGFSHDDAKSLLAVIDGGRRTRRFFYHPEDQPAAATGTACVDAIIWFRIIEAEQGDYVIEADVTIRGINCCNEDYQTGDVVRVYDESGCFFSDEALEDLVDRYGWATKMRVESELPVVRGVGTVASGTGAITPALPTGCEVNDLLVLLLETNESQAITVSGWTEAPDSPQETTGTRLTIFWRRFVEGDTDPTTSDSGDHQIGRIISVKGVTDVGDPWNVTSGSVDSTSDTTGSITGDTTTSDNCLVLVACSTTRDAVGTSEFSNWVNADLDNITERMDDTTDAGTGGGFGVITGELPTAGAYGATSVDLTNASRKAQWTGALVPLTCKFVVDGLCCAV